MLRKLPWLEDVPSVIDISTVAFADDIRVVHPVEINVLSTPAQEAERFLAFAVKEARHLSEELKVEGYSQNLGKAELLPRLQWKGSHLVLRGMTGLRDDPLLPRVVLEARHLGLYCHYKLLAHLECQRRIRGVKNSAPVAHGLWRASTCYTTKRSALLAHVVGPIMSAAEAILYSASDWGLFDKLIAQYGRRALNGQATEKIPQPDGTTRYRAWTNEKVWRHWRLHKASTEARVRRLKWLQEISERPQVHCQILAALFGDIPFESTRACNEGRIIGAIGPWARRLIDDISSMAHLVDGGEDFIEDLDSRWLRLFCNGRGGEIPQIRRGKNQGKRKLSFHPTARHRSAIPRD